MPFRCGYICSETNGTVPMTGAEDTVFEVTGYKHHVEAYIDLTNMQAGDTIYIRQYMKLTSGGAYVKYAEIPYEDAQSYKLLWITPKPSSFGLKVTAEQTAGVNRTLTYQLFKENRRG